MNRIHFTNTIALVLAVCAILTSCQIGRGALRYTVATGGEADRGKQLIRDYGCGSCHTIPGIREARGLVGPPLIYFARRSFIAGQVPNTPDNLVRWITSPESIAQNTAMPTLGLSTDQARDVAAYLYTLQGRN